MRPVKQTNNRRQTILQGSCRTKTLYIGRPSCKGLCELRALIIGRQRCNPPGLQPRIVFLSFTELAGFREYCNDPSAGSPTETLLRLLLPLNDQVWSSSQHRSSCRNNYNGTNPTTLLNHSIGSSDGRCVQRAGT